MKQHVYGQVFLDTDDGKYYLYLGDNNYEVITQQAVIDDALAALAQLEATVATKQDAEPGKGLSTNDFTDEAKAEISLNSEEINELQVTNANQDQQIQQIKQQVESSLGGVKAVITTASPAPTIDGLYALNGAGTYTNLGGLVLPANTLGYVLKSGNTYSPIFVPFSLTGVVAKVADSNVVFALKDDNNFTYGYVAKDLTTYVATDKRKRVIVSIPIISNTKIIAGTQATSATVDYLPQFFAADGSYYSSAARKPKDSYNRLKGRRMVIISNSMDADRNASTGDPLYNITASVNSRWAYIRDKFGVIMAKIDAIRSTSMAIPSADLNPPTIPYVDDSRLLTLQGTYDPKQIDIVLIGDLVNDLVGRNVPAGTINSANKADVYGATNYAYDYLTTTFINAKIVQLGVQPFHRAGDPRDFINATTGLTTSQLRTIVEAQCKRYNVLYCPLEDIGPVTYNNAVNTSLVPDGLHLTGALQYSRVGPVIGSFLNRLF